MNRKAEYVLSEAKKPNASGHRCHAEGCDAKVPPAMFMCKRHWFMVPTGLRNRVWELYEPGQEISKDASAEYIAVAREAIAAVAAREAA